MTNPLKLSAQRFRHSSEHQQGDQNLGTEQLLEKLRGAYESDRGRVLNSAAVRRLQQKTQVFPLESNSAVRSRLTHSLEVMQVGRHIVQHISQHAPKSLGINDFESSLETLVEMACVLHDVGNPPFGHFGEQAISEWFVQHAWNIYQTQHNATNNESLKQLETELFNDITHFEGNAQAIRLVHHLMDLNLSNSLVASILKYTRCGTHPKPNKTHPQSYLQKKVGYYWSEHAFVNQLHASLNIAPGHRHPASYIMEAADDISYCMADLEDAVVKNILSVSQLQQALINEYHRIIDDFGLINKGPQTADSSPNMSDWSRYEDAANEHKMAFICHQAEQAFDQALISKDSAFFVKFRVGIVHPLVKHASERFIENFSSVSNGSFNQALLEDKSYEHALSLALKNVALKHVFCVKEVETIELQGYQILHGLFDKFGVLLHLDASDFMDVCLKQSKAFPLHTRLVNRLGKRPLDYYVRTVNTLQADYADNQPERFRTTEFYYRCRLLQDHVSGMTDQYALDEYRLLHAM